MTGCMRFSEFFISCSKFLLFLPILISQTTIALPVLPQLSHCKNILEYLVHDHQASGPEKIVLAFSDLITSIPPEVLKGMLARQDPFYFPYGSNVNYVGLSEAFKILKSIIESEALQIVKDDLLGTLLLEVSGRLAFLESKDYAQKEIAAQISKVKVSRRTFEFGASFPKEKINPIFFPIPHSENVAILLNEKIAVYSQQELASLHQTKTPLFTIEDKPRNKKNAGIKVMAVSPDGRWIAAGYYYQNQIRIYDAQTGKHYPLLKLPIRLSKDLGRPEIYHLIFSSDSTQILGSSFRGNVLIVDINKKKLVRDFKARHIGGRLASSKNGQYLAVGTRNVSSSGQYEPIVYFWDLNQKTRRPKVLHGSKESNFESILLFAHDDSFFLLISPHSSELNLWNPKNGRPIRNLKLKSNEFVAAAINPINHQIVTFSYSPVVGQVWKSSSRQPIATLDGTLSTIRETNLVISPDGNLIFAADENKILVWTSVDFELVGSFELSNSNFNVLSRKPRIIEIKLSSDGKFLLVLGEDAQFASLNVEEILR